MSNRDVWCIREVRGSSMVDDMAAIQELHEIAGLSSERPQIIARALATYRKQLEARTRRKKGSKK